MAKRYLKKMISNEFIKTVGRGKNARYMLNESKNDTDQKNNKLLIDPGQGFIFLYDSS